MSVLPNQLQTFYLSGSGAVIGATSVTLKSMLTIDGSSLTMSTDFGTIAYGTIDPGNSTLEEQISFTGLTNNANGTVTLTGVSSVTFDSPYTATSGLLKTHAGSAPFVISNTSGFYGTYANKQNTETITGYWAVPDPVSMTDIANKQYVLSVVTGGTISINKLIPAATAGETVAAGNVVYLKVSDGYWYLAKANDTTKIFNVQLGIAQGAGTAGNSITGGVLIEGLDSNQSGLSPGTTYYVNNSGAVSATAGDTARIIGQGGQSATTLYFNPNYNFVSPADLLFDVLAGENLTANDSVYISTSDGKAYKTDSDDFTKLDFAGIVVASVSSSATAQIRLSGKSSISGLTTGSRYYVSPTAGGITATAPATWVSIGVALSTNVLEIDKYPSIRTHVFTATGTWTKRPGLKFIEVELVGGGGGGGGTTTANESSGGGSGGGYSKKTIAANTLTDLVTATIGAGGTAGASTGGTGGTGGTTSFGSYLQATGGGGGTTNGSSDNAAPGIGSSGDINIKGQGGGAGSAVAGISSGAGGSSMLGGGAISKSDNGVGVDGGNYGGGGSGARCTGGADTAGGAGAPGVVIVYEHY